MFSVLVITFESFDAQRPGFANIRQKLAYGPVMLGNGPGMSQK